MALNRLFPSDYVFHTLDGQDPAAAGVIYFYTNNTDNLATVYTDVGGITPSSNPLTLGSDGRLPNSVFTSATLRVKLLDSLGAQIFQKDDITAATGLGSLSASSGSSLISFIHSGAGAVATTLQTRGRKVIYASDYGATGDGATTDTTTLQAALTAAAGYTLVIPAGTYLTGALTLPANTRVVGEGYNKTILKAVSATGSLNLLTIANSNCSVEDLTINLDNTAVTIAAGYVASRNGIYVYGLVGAYITNIYLKVQVKNCGEAGIKCQYVDRLMIDRADIDRCGQYGIYTLSCSNVWVESPDIYDIFPGSGGTPPYLNAYGITFTYSGTDPKPVDCTVSNGMVEYVTSWEAYDTHGGDRIRFLNCSSKNCNQGIVVQSTVENYASNDIQIIGGTHDGYGATTRDSTAFDTSGGIIANMGNSAYLLGDNLTIKGVTIRDMGGKVTGTTAGGIKIEDCDNFLVEGCNLVNGYQWALRCAGTNLNGKIFNNAINTLTEANSIKTGMSFSDTTLVTVDGNTIHGMPASSTLWSIPAPSTSAYGVKFGANNTVENSGIDNFSDTSYNNILAGSGFLGVAKAWLQYNGSTDTINAKYGVTGVVKNSTGVYTITFANTIALTDAIIIATGNRFVRKASGAATSSVQILTENPIATPADDEELSVVVFGLIQRK